MFTYFMLSHFTIYIYILHSSKAENVYIILLSFQAYMHMHDTLLDRKIRGLDLDFFFFKILLLKCKIKKIFYRVLTQ